MKVKDNKIEPVSKTLAILDEAAKDSKSKVTIATEEGVLDAKDWVDNVEK